ncbi:hypothetical protein [Phyllobacterium ifriqiyense]|uniref:hypothetical protein n=1 Tax=Phyllobacterium ifriqiyense TaxID=314238 RepID=UPI0033954E38
MRYLSSMFLAAVIVSGCTPVATRTELVTAAKNQQRSAGPGDVVMEFKSTKPLPNAFGKADLFGRTTDAGRTTVRYLGSSGNRAIFERQDISVETNATTMNQTPLILPTVSNTTLDGTIGNRAVSGTATSTSYSVVGPRPASQYITSASPIQITLSSGQSIKLQGKTLTVLRVSPGSVEYRVD